MRSPLHCAAVPGLKEMQGFVCGLPRFSPSQIIVFDLFLLQVNPPLSLHPHRRLVGRRLARFWILAPCLASMQGGQDVGPKANFGSQGVAALSAAAPAAGAAGAPEQQQQQDMFGLPQRPQRWVKYYIQRAKTNASHALFYVVDEAGLAKLAVVVRGSKVCRCFLLLSGAGPHPTWFLLSPQGTDVKLSGHFVYASVSDMTEAPALRCTNRWATRTCKWAGQASLHSTRQQQTARAGRMLRVFD